MNNLHKNSNFIGEDDLLHNIYEGNQTVATLKKAFKEITALTTQLRQENKPVLVLTDIRNLGLVNLQARVFAVEFIKNVDFDRVAIFGNPLALERIVNVIIQASGRGFKMKYFTSGQDAKSWLLGK